MILAATVLLILITTVWIAFNKKKFLCNSCRYMVNRNRTGIQIDTCRIFGSPACVDECKFYEKINTNK